MKDMGLVECKTCDIIYLTVDDKGYCLRCRYPGYESSGAIMWYTCADCGREIQTQIHRGSSPFICSDIRFKGCLFPVKKDPHDVNVIL